MAEVPGQEVGVPGYEGGSVRLGRWEWQDRKVGRSG
jgi:hypothetical protein